MCCNVLHIKNITRCAIGIHPSEFGINMHTDSQFWQVFITDTSDESAMIYIAQVRFSPLPFQNGGLLKSKLMQVWLESLECTSNTVNNSCIPQMEQQRTKAFLSGECYLISWMLPLTTSDFCSAKRFQC